VLGDRFSSEELIMALLPWLLHLGIGPTDAGGALWAALLMTTLPAGTPAPVGGSGRLVEALTGLVSACGGEIRTGVDVDAVVTAGGRATGVRTTKGEQLTATQAVIASTTPDQLYGRLLRDAPGIPESTRAQARRYSYRRGCFQINLALSTRPRFADSRLDGGGGINVGRGLSELLTSVQQAEVGLLPTYPSISWHEPTAVDPTRAPAGHAVVRLQVLDVPLCPTGDAAEEIAVDGGWTAAVAERFADRVISEAAQHISGLEQMVLARHILSPADLARTNPNAGPGDHASGHNALSQAFTQRPIPAHSGGYATAVPDLYLIGAASWPGPGVGGTSGRAVARRLLNRPDSRETPRKQPPTRTMESRSVDRTDVTFPSGGASCAGWLYRPADADGNVPCVVMAHGFSLTRHDGLVAYAQALAEAGAAVLVYDHRYLGDSGDQPRQLVRMSAQLHDRRCAIAYARGLHGIDADKIVVWGYSISGGTAVKAAASDPRVAGAILLCPFLDGRARAITDLTADPGNVAWLFAQAIKDMAGSHSLVPATAPPGGHGVLTLRGEADGFKTMIDADSPWRNEVAAGPFATAAFYRPVTKARKLACPVLVQLCERDISAPSRPIQNLAQRAPRAELKRYDLDHFQPFYGNNPAGIAADQADWLKRTVLNA
jgi:phytoene dehydrogenase-like protein/dienelactone hydrolase